MIPSPNAWYGKGDLVLYIVYGFGVFYIIVEFTRGQEARDVVGVQYEFE